MADVNQKLGFDASQAVASLESLSFSIDTVNQRIQTLNKVAKGNPTASLNAGAKQTQATISGLQAKINSLQKTMAQTGAAGKKAGDDITLSWQTLFRVLQTQVLLRGLGELQQQFNETADAARAFELQVARISTITDEGFGGGRNELESSIRSLAVELGKPLDEVSSAAFQTLQNDIADTTQESLEFLRVSNSLSVTLGSDLEDALNSLTSVQKAYGQGVESAADNADIFFTAIDKGRLTLDELTNRLGTITPLAAALNVPFDQVAASVAALSQAGLNTATSTTQLRNVLSKLIRPTQELQDAFKELGVSSGTELLASVGGSIPDALRALQGALGGTEEAVANAFGTIRGQLGTLNLLAQSAGEGAQLFEAFENRAGRAAEALAKVEDTDARRFEKEVAALNDTMLDLGNASQAVQLQFLETFNAIIPDIQSAKAALIGLGVAGTIAFSNMGVAASRAAISFAAAAGPIGLVAVGIGALAAAIVNDIPDFAAEFRASIAQLDQDIAANNRSFEQAQKDSTKRVNEELAIQLSAYEAFYDDLSDLYADDNAAFQKNSELAEITAQRLVDSFSDSRGDLLSKVDNFLAGIDDRIADGTERVQDALQDLDDFRFDKAQKGLTETQQAYNALARAQNTAIAAQRAFNAAGGNQEALESARELQKLAQQQARDAERAAGRADSGGLQQQAEQLQERLLRERVAQEKQTVSQIEAIGNASAGRQRDRLAQLLDEQVKATEKIEQLRGRFDTEGNAKTGEQILEDTRSIVPLQKAISEAQSEINKLTILDDAGVRDFANRTSLAFQQGLSQANFDFDNVVLSLRAALANEKFGINFEIPTSGIGSIQALIGDNFGAGVGLGEGVRKTEEELRNLILTQETFRNEASLSEANINDQSRALEALVSNIERAAGVASDPSLGESLRTGFKILTSGQDFNGVLEDVKTLVGVTRQFGQITQSIRDAGNTEQSRAAAESALSDLQNEISQIDFFDENQRAKLNSAAELTRTLIGEFATLQTKNDVIDPIQAAESARLLELIGQEATQVSEKLNSAKSGSGGVKTGVDSINQSMPSLVQSSGQVAANWQRAAAAAAATAQAAANAAPGSAGAIDSNYFGGITHRNTGGDLTRGQDQQLVAASAGESFINARSSSRFFAELRAINAGQSPAFREQGGPVTNIGDVNVNVDARNATSVDGRNIARQLNRELRRTSSNLRG